MTRVFLPVAALALLAGPGAAQRPALTGEKAQVADAVKADLSRLSDLQTAHHNRNRAYAAEARDLNFTPTSGATINIAYASMNAWAANATHPTLSPVACFIIISSAEPTGAAAQPFCQEGRPSTSAPTATSAPSTTPDRSTPSTTTTTAAQPARETAPAASPSRTAAAPATRQEPGMSPAQRAQPLRAPSSQPAPTGGPAARPAEQPALSTSDIPASARAGTRDIDASGVTVQGTTENVTPQQFSAKLSEFAQGATTVRTQNAAELERIVRDPYESTAEFEARRNAAVEAAQRREREFFQQQSKTYNVAMPVREVRYDPDREVLEFTVDGLGLPVSRGTEPNAAATLTFTCFSRPVFWCSPEGGMIYEAGDLWKIARATARQHDVLRTPLTLNARFAVGRRNDESILAITLLSMDLQARGQSVSRWDGTSR